MRQIQNISRKFHSGEAEDVNQTHPPSQGIPLLAIFSAGDNPECLSIICSPSSQAWSFSTRGQLAYYSQVIFLVQYFHPVEFTKQLFGNIIETAKNTSYVMLYRWGSLIDRDTLVAAADCGDSLALPLLCPSSHSQPFLARINQTIIILITSEHQQSKSKCDRIVQWITQCIWILPY